jgi:hypothetical protein
MIKYRIVHHVPGRIRIEVPAIRELSFKALDKLSNIPIPCGIKGIRPNPITGSLLIQYDPQRIDIMTYLKNISSREEMKCIFNEGGLHEGY